MGLANNSIRGTLPAQWATFNNMTDLILNDNHLSGMVFIITWRMHSWYTGNLSGTTADLWINKLSLLNTAKGLAWECTTAKHLNIAELVLVQSCRHFARSICLHVKPAKDLSAAQLFHRCAINFVIIVHCLVAGCKLPSIAATFDQQVQYAWQETALFVLCLVERLAVMHYGACCAFTHLHSAFQVMQKRCFMAMQEPCLPNLRLSPMHVSCISRATT